MRENNKVYIDVSIGLSYGDCGKSVPVYFLTDPKNQKDGKQNYTHCIRFNGGGNAGHTIYHNDVKYISHLIPVGIFHGLKSIIGSGCVLNVKSFFEELNDLKSKGFDVDNKVFISKQCHIVTDAHLEEEKNETAIGTTKRGIGPCYRDKVDRKGIRAEQVPELEPYLIDMYEEFYVKPGIKNVFAEGAQGFYLDVDLGDYPYVTSSNCGIGALINNGFSHKDIRIVWGVGKVYETYVGSKQFHGKDPIFDKIQEVGKEFGATTGRRRQCNLLNLDNLIKAVRCLGVTAINLRKLDILEEVKFFRFIYNEVEWDFDNSDSFCEKIHEILEKETNATHIIFSENPYGL